MVRKEGTVNSLSSKAVKDLLTNKFVVIIGDSNQRAIYKDLISLLQSDKQLRHKDLKAKGEMKFLGDTLIEGGVKGQMNNGINYTEVRQYQVDTHLIRFYFVTRCYNPYVESILRDLESGPSPDLVIMNSCLWDMTRYGTTAIRAYKENLGMLFNRLSKVLSSNCLMIWNTTLPISRNARGGFLVKEIEFDNNMLRLDVLEANFFARQIVVAHDFDVVDLHFWFRRKLHLRAPDGIHWLPAAHRQISAILLTHVSTAWGVPFPSFQVSSQKQPAQSSNSVIPQSLENVAERLNGDSSHRQGNWNRKYHRSAPYPLQPPPERAFYQEQYYTFGNTNCDNDFGYGPNQFSMPFNGYGNMPMPLLSVPQNFYNQWSPYSNDSFCGAQRQPNHWNYSRYSMY